MIAESHVSTIIESSRYRLAVALDGSRPGNYYRRMERDISAEVGSSFRTLLEALPDIVYVLDDSGRFLFLNGACRNLGYEPSSLIGKHFSTVLHPEDRDSVSRDSVVARIRTLEKLPVTPPKLFDERRSGSRMTKELDVRLVNGSTGETVYGSVNAYGEPLVGSALSTFLDEKGPVTMGVIHDITAQKLYQRSLEENIAAKELLLREIHHRVKNNLQVIASIAHIREMEAVQEESRSVLSGLIAQIKSMAMVHEALYQTENLGGVSSKEYFEKFSRFMQETYGHVGSPVGIELEIMECQVKVEILSYLAMVANELVANAFKHAFPDNRKGTITLKFKCAVEGYTLSVTDDGIGLPEEGKREIGIGSTIVDALASQMGGTVTRSGSSGTRVTVSIPHP